MDGRGVAWLSYLPIPGLAVIPVLLHPGDRLARYHAWQGGLLVGAFFVLMFVFGLLMLLSEAAGYRQTLGLLSGLVLVVGVVQMLWGAVASALGRYPRLRPAWDLASALRREP
jgi:Na+/melibiose symporter-like transporter